jgi:serine protease
MLKQTAGYKGLNISSSDQQQFTNAKTKHISPDAVSAEQYFFGSGLVNAAAAVREVKRRVFLSQENYEGYAIELAENSSMRGRP